MLLPRKSMPELLVMLWREQLVKDWKTPEDTLPTGDPWTRREWNRRQKFMHRNEVSRQPPSGPHLLKTESRESASACFPGPGAQLFCTAVHPGDGIQPSVLSSGGWQGQLLFTDSGRRDSVGRTGLSSSVSSPHYHSIFVLPEKPWHNFCPIKKWSTWDGIREMTTCNSLG